MSLKPRNIVQAAEADIKRSARNAVQAADRDKYAVSYEQYAFHRKHVRRADTAQTLMLLALMDNQTGLQTTKQNTRLIYGDAALLVQAIRLTSEDQSNGRLGG